MEEKGLQVPFPNTTAILKLFPDAATRYGIATLTSIPSEQAVENGEARVQLLEGCEYEFELYGPLDLNLRMVGELSGILSFSRLTHNRPTGRIRPGLFVGTINVGLYDSEENEISRLPLEVRSVKLDYRDHYRQMLGDIAARCFDLLLQIRAPAVGKVLTDPGKDAETIGQRFEFLRTLVDTPEFQDAITRITSMPHHRMERHDQRTRSSARLRPTRSLNRQIVQGTRRTGLPDGHELRKLGIQSFPEYVTIGKRQINLDTPENRFVKFALSSFLTFLQSMRRKLVNIGESTESPLNLKIASVERSLHSLLAVPFFREISDPLIVPLSSPVLQRREGYRELLRAWLLFDAAARLFWTGGDDVYSAGRRNVAALYEYWVFFRLLDIVADEFNLDAPPTDELIEETADGFGLKLKSGRHLAFKGTCAIHGRMIRVQFNYNRTFSRRGGDEEFNYPEPGSWTERMRPDYTLSLWPNTFDEVEAERQELIVHIHFDAKYRVDQLDQIFGKSDRQLGADGVESELTSEEEEQIGGIYNRGDLLKMHAYRDAIRRSAGAYVIYPGSGIRKWRHFHEIIPGLGAFPLRPDANGDGGTGELREFIRDVVRHVSNQATLRERESYHRYAIHNKPETLPVIQEAPETLYDGLDRHPPPAETTVLVASVDNDSHLAWVRSEQMYNLRIDSQSETTWLTSDLAGSRYLLLIDNNGKAIDGLFWISSEGPRVISDDDLKNSGYPGELSSLLYLAFNVREHPDFVGYIWDYSSIAKRALHKAGQNLFTISLAELLYR